VGLTTRRREEGEGAPHPHPVLALALLLWDALLQVLAEALGGGARGEGPQGAALALEHATGGGERKEGGGRRGGEEEAQRMQRRERFSKASCRAGLGSIIVRAVISTALCHRQ